MSAPDTIHQKVTKVEYEPVSSSYKLTLLLQRSIRHSYRQRCCKCCPMMLCELLFPVIIIILLALTRSGINRLSEKKQNNDSGLPRTFVKRPCSQDLNLAPISSSDIFTRCFKFPPSYNAGHWTFRNLDDVSNQINLVFEPNRTDINELVQYATMRLAVMKCNKTNVW